MYLLKPIDKVGVRPVSEYPGRNLRERRGSLVKVKNHWPSLSIMGEGGIFLSKLANREKNGGGVKFVTIATVRDNSYNTKKFSDSNKVRLCAK